MAISVVQTATGTVNPPLNFASAVTPGNTVFLVVAQYDTGGTANSVIAVKFGGSTQPGTVAFFDAGNTGCVNSGSLGGNVASVSIWMIPNIQVSGQTAVDYTGSGSQIGQVIYEVSGLGASPVLDQSSTGSSTTLTTIDSGTTAAITAAPEFIIAASMVFAGAASPGGGWTTQNPSTDQWAGYQVATSSGGTYDWQQTGAGNPWAAGIATVAVSLAAPGAAVPPAQPGRTWLRRFHHPQHLTPPPPAAPGTSGQVQPWPTVPVPRRRLARGLWGGVKGAGFVAVLAPGQGPYLPPRRKLARAVWAGSRPFTGFVAVPAPKRLPPIPRRVLAPAVWRGSRPFTGFVQVPAPPQGPYRPPRQILVRALWRGGPVPFIFPVPNRQPPYLPPRRTLARAVLGFPREGTVPLFVAVPAPQQLPTFPRRVIARAMVRGTPLVIVNAVPVPEFVNRETPDDKSHIKKIMLLLGE